MMQTLKIDKANWRLRRAECFYFWLVSNSLSMAVHFLTGLTALGVRDLIFLVLSVAGLRAWKKATAFTTEGTERKGKS